MALARLLVTANSLMGFLGTILFLAGGLGMFSMKYDAMRKDGILQSMQPLAIPLYSCPSMANALNDQSKDNAGFAKMFVQQQCISKQAGTAFMILTNGATGLLAFMFSSMMGLFWKKRQWVHVPTAVLALASSTLMLASIQVMMNTISGTTSTWVDCQEYTTEQISKYSALDEGALLCAGNDPSRNGEDNPTAMIVLGRVGMMYAGIIVAILAHAGTLAACTWRQRKALNDQGLLYQQHIENDAASSYS